MVEVIKRGSADLEVLKETEPLLAKPLPDEGLYSEVLPVEFIRDLIAHFGYKLVVLLFVVQHLLKGFTNDLVGVATPYLFEAYHVPGPVSQIYGSVTSLPWAMKPAIGLASDVLPIGGYRKAPYFLLTTFLAVIAFIMLGQVSQDNLPIQLVVVGMFFTSLQASTCDLLSEAKYAEKIQDNPERGPALLTYVWFGATVGGLAAAMLGGTVIGAFGPKAVFVIAAVPASAVVIPVVLGYLEETPMGDEELRAVRRRFADQKEACALCLIMLIGTIALSICGIIYRDPRTNGLLAIGIGVVVISSFTVVLSPAIAKFNAYSVIQGSLSLSISGASFYFYTDGPEAYPEGPHFSPLFYNTVMGVTGSFCSLYGIYCYNKYMSGWRYRHLLVMSNVVYSLLCVIDIAMFARVNVRWGVSDHVFMMSSSVLESVVAQWMWMPQVVIFSYLCPRGMEATMYALLAGCANLGNNIAANVGALMLHELGCSPRGAPGESDQFDNLWLAAAISTVLPALTIVLIFWLVPDAKQGEPLIDGEVEAAADATTGSLWRRWTGT